MFSLTDAYEKGTSSTIMTVIMGVTASLLFTVGLFLIFSSHNNSQSRQLQLAIDAVKKNLTKSGTSSDAALLSLEAALAAQQNGKPLPTSISLDTLTVKGASTLQSSVNVGKDATIGGKLDVKKNANLEGDLTVSGDTSVAGLTTSSDINGGGSLTTTGDGSIGGNLQASGDTQLNGSLTVSGDTSLAGLTTSSDINGGGSLDVSGDTRLSGSLTVSGDTSLAGLTTSSDISGGGTLEVTGNSQLDGGLTVSGNTTTDTLTTNGDTSIDGKLTVSGAVQFNGGVNLSGGTTTDTITTTDAATIGSDLQVNGNTTLGQVDSQSQLLGGGDLQVYGDTTLGGAFSYDLTSVLSITDFTNAAWTSTGWTTTSTTATHNTGNTSPLSTAQVTPTIGQKYQVNYTVSGSPASSTLVASFGGQTVANSTFSGGTGITVSTVITASTTAGLIFTPSSTFNGVISAVSVKHVNSINQSGGNLTVKGSLDVTGGATIGSTLDVTGATTLGSTLDVSGAATLNDTLDVAGTATFNNGLAVSGDTATDTLTTSGDGSIGGNLGISGNFSVTGAVTLPSGAGAITLDDASVGQSIGIGTGNTCTGEHIHISAIENGIVTDAHCQANGICTGVCYDLAENYPSKQNLKAGEVVEIDPSNSQYVLVSSTANNNMAIGVVSTAPAETLGADGPGYPIALAGRVPVNVTNEGGAIAPGDYLTSSSTPGYAMKAALGNKTIGQALEAFTGTTGTVNMFVNVAPGASQESLIQGAQPPITTANLTSLNVSGPTSLTDLQVTGLATINNLTVTGLATVVNLQINGHIVGNGDTRGVVTIPTGSTTVHHDFTTAYSQVPSVVASPTNQAVLYTVVPTATGFDINLPTPATVDTNFDYLAQQ